MNLAILLAPGDSFANMRKTGQDERFKESYLKFYAKKFKKVYVFSFANEKVKNLPSNVIVVPNKYNLHRYLYSLLLPFFNSKQINESDVLRVFHLSATAPAIVSKIFFSKPFVFNWAYDYEKFADLENKNMQKILFKIIKPLALHHASKVFAANKKILNTLPTEKRVYLPNGVDIKFFKPTLKTRRNINTQILSVGRLEKQKNFEQLIKSVRGLKVELTLIGSGIDKNKLLELAQKQKVNLTIIDKVPNTRIANYYNNSDIFVLSSIQEGSPKVLLEAMACGVPVVSSKVGGANEIIQNGVNGLISSTDAKSLNKSIKKLINNLDLRTTLSKNARALILDQFSLNKILTNEVNQIKNLKNATKQS